MQIHCYSPVYFEPWDFRTPDETGIGGSETAVVETAWRLAQRGHDVTVYAPIRDDCPTEDKGGAKWRKLEDADWTAPGLWILHRCPSALDNFGPRGWLRRTRNRQTTWLVCQDVFYPPRSPEGLNDERVEKLDLCLPLCSAQEKYLLEVSPKLQGKTCISSNGLRVNLINGDVLERDPYKLVYTSSPDRGLPALLKIFKRAKERVPQLNLSIAYGWNNIDKCKGKNWVRVKEECLRLSEQPGVTWLGRLPQPQLYREFLSAGLWVYPTVFTETSCCTCMEAQALGAIPITNPLWALADNVRHGVFINGDPAGEPLTQTRYAYEIVRLCQNPQLQEQIRPAMQHWAVQQFSWERVVNQWEMLMNGGPKTAFHNMEMK